MKFEKFKPILTPSACVGEQMKKKTEWLRFFSQHELNEIDHALEQVKQRGMDLFDIEKKDFELPCFAAGLKAISEQLENGIGMLLLRGLPLTYSPEDLRIVYWGLGAHLGTAVSQNKYGELFGLVKDFGEPVVNTTRRGSRTSLGLQFHSDRCDVVGLLCVRKAKSGGASRIVSSTAMHNEILRRRPDLMQTFYDDWIHSWQGEQPAGYDRTYIRPIFGFRDGFFTGMFSPAYTQFAQEYPEVPRHTPAQLEALQLYSELSMELALDMHFEPGDIQLLNNHVIYHGRTDFEDYPEPHRKRLLLRLWLSVPEARPLPKGYEVVYGSHQQGEIRGGVPCREGGWRDVTQFRKHRTGIHALQGAFW